ncbi:MAG: class C sortase [Propionibacteriaceae bacterium]|nr:class C sortase [Propionibacteriaceae bacterium]
MTSSRRRWRPAPLSLVAAAVAWLGLAVLLYPSVANWFSEVQQSKIITSYTEEVDAGVDPPAARQLQLAHDYNAALSSGALLEANERLPTGEGTSTDASLDYDDILRVDTTGVMARVRIPGIGVDLPVYHGTSDETLLQGVGHLQGTSLPVGGEGTHAVLTAHRGLATAALFTDLNQVVVGDTFSIVVFDQVLTYQVVRTIVVEPDETEALRPVEGKDLVTLVTCTPLGINSQRILVTGERVIPTPVKDVEAAAAKPDIPGFPWWIVLLGAGSALVGLYAWRSGYPPRSRRLSPS